MAVEGILVINPGSTSTKVAFFQGEEVCWEETLSHGAEEIAAFVRIVDQYEFRRQAIMDLLEAKGVNLFDLAAVVGRGGLLAPLGGGTYCINDRMIEELREGARGEHASNLGAILAREIAEGSGGIPAFIVDPVVVDELEPLARISGMAGVERRSIFHALNQKAVARRAAKELGALYEEVNLVVAHLGGGVSVGVHCHGRVIDVNNALDGEGPFSPERSGGVPVGDVIRLCFSESFTQRDIYRRVVGGGGLVAYLGTNDAREVEVRIREGDEEARLIYEAMAYQIAKEIGAGATVLRGELDGIVITGGLAHSQMMTGWLRERISFLAPVFVFPGEGEMAALAAGALRVLRGEEEGKEYRGVK